VEAAPDRVVSVEPPTAVVSRLRPDTPVADFRAEICDLGNFFDSAQAATDWQAHYPNATLVPIVEDFEVNRQAMIELGWAGTRVRPMTSRSSARCALAATAGCSPATSTRSPAITVER
jgi:Alkylmercury lyase